MNPISSMHATLNQRFKSLLTNFEVDDNKNDELWKVLSKHYTQKSRHYHNLTHLENMFNELDKWKGEIEDIEILQFSIFYHDIIYKSTRKDNELRSAEVAKEVLSFLGSAYSADRLSSNRITRCFHQIILTQHHHAKEDDGLDEKLLLDFDLEILSRDWEQYKIYAQQIRKEYSIYPNFLYRKGRKKALASFLERKKIYQTEWYQENCEPQARQNIRKEIEELL